MSKYEKLSDKDWLERRYVKDELSYRELAKEVGCSNSHLLRTLDKHGIKRRDNRSSKYKLLDDEAWLRQKYLVEKKSTLEIAKLAGAKTCNSARQNLIKFGIPVRSVGEGLTCNRTEDGLVIDKDTIQVLEGGLLGDAGMRKWKKGSKNANSLWCRKNKYHDHVVFVADQLGIDSNRIKERNGFCSWDKAIPYSTFALSTLSHAELNSIYDRWYPESNDYVKVVPKDFVLTEISLLHWFMDDGSSHRRKREYKNTRAKSIARQNHNQILIVFCSESFTKEENQFLADQLSDLFGLDARVRPYREGSGWRIHIPQSKAQLFFEVIGDCPVPSMEYKWK